MCGATRKGCFFANNSCSLTKGVVNFHAISWCCFCVKIYFFLRTTHCNQSDRCARICKQNRCQKNAELVTSDSYEIIVKIDSRRCFTHTLWNPCHSLLLAYYGCRRVWIRLCSSFIDKSRNFLTLTGARNQRTSLSSELTRVHCK